MSHHQGLIGDLWGIKQVHAEFYRNHGNDVIPHKDFLLEIEDCRPMLINLYKVCVKSSQQATLLNIVQTAPECINNGV